MTLQKYWYLGFLGFVGIYFLPDVAKVFSGDASYWTLTNLLWLLWFLNFLPEETSDEQGE